MPQMFCMYISLLFLLINWLFWIDFNLLRNGIRHQYMHKLAHSFHSITITYVVSISPHGASRYSYITNPSSSLWNMQVHRQWSVIYELLIHTYIRKCILCVLCGQHKNRSTRIQMMSCRAMYDMFILMEIISFSTFSIQSAFISILLIRGISKINGVECNLYMFFFQVANTWCSLRWYSYMISSVFRGLIHTGHVN